MGFVGVLGSRLVQLTEPLSFACVFFDTGCSAVASFLLFLLQKAQLSWVVWGSVRVSGFSGVFWGPVRELDFLDPRIQAPVVRGLCLRRMKGIFACPPHSHRHRICIPCGAYRRRRKQAFGNRTDCTRSRGFVVPVGHSQVQELGVRALERARTDHV